MEAKIKTMIPATKERTTWILVDRVIRISEKRPNVDVTGAEKRRDSDA